MKTMCPPGGFEATHAIGHMMYIACWHVRGMAQKLLSIASSADISSIFIIHE